MRYDWDATPEALWPFLAHGVEFTQHNRDQWRGTCPWDEKSDKFYVNPQTGQWDNKSTGDKGNTISFLGAAAEYYEEQMTQGLLKKLSKDRGLPIEAFRGLELGWDPVTEHFMLPVRSPKGTVRDIRRWNFENRRFMTTKGCRPMLWGMDGLDKLKKGTIVWILEGEWDRIAMRWWLKELTLDHYTVGLPGAMVFKEDWPVLFEKLDVIDVHDNDAAGDKGATRVREVFHKAGVKLRYVNWPEHWPDGYDVRDFVCYALEHKIKLRTAWRKFESLVGEVQRRDKGEDEFSAVDPSEKVTYLSDDEAPTFEELVETYRRYLNMDSEMVLALKFILAIIYSQQLGQKEPLWAYLVAAAGGGKTALLSAMAGCKRTVFRSTVTPNSLVSGFKSAHDPSLLPKLSGKTFIIKDFTTTLSGADFEFERVMAILRDAFDGDFQQSYGNDVHRKYDGLHFSMVAGVTPAIHAKPMALMGERFLKFCMKTADAATRMDRLMATARTVGRDLKMEKELQDITERFLSRRVIEEDIPIPPRDFQLRLAGLAQILSGLRAQVNRDRYDRDNLLYRPEPEVGTRPFKQFMKLARALYVTLRKKKYDQEVYGLVERVAMDSCTGFNIELVHALMNGQGGGTLKDVARSIDLSYATADRAMRDLEVLKIVGKEVQPAEDHGTGRPPSLWRVRGEMRKCWKQAMVGSPYVQTGAVRVRVRRRRS